MGWLDQLVKYGAKFNIHKWEADGRQFNLDTDLYWQWRTEGGGRGAWPPGASLGGGAELSRARGDPPRVIFFFVFCFFCLSIFEIDAGFTKRGGRRSKHWPPGAGDPRDATAYWIRNEKTPIWQVGFFHLRAFTLSDRRKCYPCLTNSSVKARDIFFQMRPHQRMTIAAARPLT